MKKRECRSAVSVVRSEHKPYVQVSISKRGRASRKRTRAPGSGAQLRGDELPRRTCHLPGDLEQCVWTSSLTLHTRSANPGLVAILPVQGTPPRRRGVAGQSGQSATGDLFFRRGPRAAMPHSGRLVRQSATFRPVRQRLSISEGALHPDRPVHHQPIASNHGCAHSRLKIPLACLIIKAKTRPHIRPGARHPRHPVYRGSHIRSS